MAYRVDDGIDTWPESIQAGTAALGLYLRCGAWICRTIAAGRIVDAIVPVDVAAMYGSKEWVTRLIEAGFWEHVEDGYADRHYFTLNPTAEKVVRDRKAKKDRQDRWLERARRGTDASLTESRDASGDIAPPLPKKRGGGRAPRSVPTAVPLADQCKTHRGYAARNCGGCRADAKADPAA